jgi:type I restriction enzyme S subunit
VKWQAVALGELTDKIGSGSTPQQGGSGSYKTNGIPLIRSMNVHDGIFKPEGLVFLDEVQAKALDHVILAENDVLLNITGASVARVCRLPPKYAGGRVNQHVAIIRPQPDKLYPDYLAQCLMSPSIRRDLLRIAGAGATREAITKANIHQFEIPLPPLDEQRRIAAILNQADDLRRKRREALWRANSLIEAIFLDTFGDPIENARGYPTKALRQLVDPKRGISYGVVQRGEDQDSGVPIIRITDVVEGDIDARHLKMTKPEIAAKFKRTALVGGEIVISIRGTIGRCAIVPTALVGGNVSREIAVIPTTSPELNDFYVALLRCRPVQARLTEDIKGIAQRGINLEDLWELPVIQPEMAELCAFLDHRAPVHGLLKEHRAHLAALDALFASLQHRAFRGEL